MMHLLRSRSLRLFSSSVADQIMLSFASFLVGLLLIRHTTDVDYGLFVLVQSTIALFVAAQSSWLAGPLTIVAPHKTPEKKQEMIGSIAIAQRKFLSLVTLGAFSIPIVCYVTDLWTAEIASIAVAGIVAGWFAMVRDYSRGVLLIYSKPHTLLRVDAVYAAIVVGGALFAAYGPGPAGLWAVVALAVGGAGGWIAAHHAIGKDPGWRGSASVARPYLNELRHLGIWSTVGATIFWIYTQSYNYLLATRVDLVAVSDVNTARLLLMPAFMFTLGIRAFLTPQAANWLARDGVSSMFRRIWLMVPFMMALNAAYIAVVWLFRDRLTGDLLQTVIHDRELLIGLWATIVLIALTKELLQCGAIVLGQPRMLAWLSASCALVALPVMWFGLSWWGPAAVLVGQACGELVSLIGLLWLLPRIISRYTQFKLNAS